LLDGAATVLTRFVFVYVYDVVFPCQSVIDVTFPDAS
jgi:hypothetical protein